MSDRAMWKMLHLLYTLPPGHRGLDHQQLNDVGITCGPDTVHPLEQSGAVLFTNGVYTLSSPARAILQSCLVANRRWTGTEIAVDRPAAFVIMPFRKTWSARVYDELIEPAVRTSGMECHRGDKIARVSDMMPNIWSALLTAGIAIVDISALNANVFYELGLAHALGKDVIVLKQAGARVPADFRGAHYHQYKLRDLAPSKRWLTKELKKWAADNRASAVSKLSAPAEDGRSAKSR